MAHTQSFRLPAGSIRVSKEPTARLWVIGTIFSLLVGGCASSTGALPAPAIDATATASSEAELHQRSFGELDSHRDLNPGSHEALDTVARAVPIQCQGGRAFIPLSRDQRFEVGLQLSRPNLFGFAMISRWQ
jgi:hypothetical protein